MAMSATRPPLAAKMAAMRRSASCAVWLLTQLAWPIAVRAANPAGSRTRAISADRPAGVAGASNQPRLGRITSAQTSSMIARPASSETCSGSRGPRPAAASHPANSPRHAGLPAASAPLVIHRSCQDSPGWSSSQSSIRVRPRRRSWSRLVRPVGNGGASSLPAPQRAGHAADGTQVTMISTPVP
jgi:hypothetical protein